MRSIIVAVAFTSAPVIASHRRLDRLDADHARLTVVVAATSRDAQEVVESIELPEGMTASRFTLAIAGQRTLRSRARMAVDALKEYDAAVGVRDPGLLEYENEHAVTLRVFPVRRDAPATVVIDLIALSVARVSSTSHVGFYTSLVATP